MSEFKLIIVHTLAPEVVTLMDRVLNQLGEGMEITGQSAAKPAPEKLHVIPDAETEAPKRNATRKPKAPAADAPEVTDNESREDGPDPANETAGAITVEALRQKVLGAIGGDKVKRKTVKAWVSEMGAEDLTSLGAEHYAELLEKIKTL